MAPIEAGNFKGKTSDNIKSIFKTEHQPGIE